jgi:hypothetical protein
MMQGLLNQLEGYNLDLDSKISDIKDGWDYIYLIISCEEAYDFVLNDSEAMFFESKDFSFSELDEFIVFLKTGVATQRTHNTVLDNINELNDIREIYMEYIIDNRDNKINDLLG